MTTNETTQYVDGNELLKILFSENSRPSLRWLRAQQKRRALPYVKIGRLVRFNVDQVRDALATSHTLKAGGVK